MTLSLKIRDVRVRRLPVRLVSLSGSLDLATVDAAQSLTLPDEGGLVLDVSPLEFLDSAGLHLLFTLLKRADASGVRVALVAPPGCLVRSTLEVAAVDQCATIHPRRHDAIEELINDVTRPGSAPAGASGEASAAPPPRA